MNYIKTNDFLIIRSLCFCLIIISLIIITYTFIDKEKGEIMYDRGVIIPSISVEVILLSLLIFLLLFLKK